MATGTDDPDSKRNLVVDEAAFEEQFLRCHICQEKFDQQEKTPKSLPCNHTFCLPCLKQVFDHHSQNTRRAFTWADETYEGVLKCPTCRVEIFLSRSEISALPNDHRVIQMIDFLSQVVVKSQNACNKHERQPLNFFCKTCLIPVCRDCTVLDHKEQDGHAIVDVSQALKDNSDDHNNIENRSKQLLQSMKARSDCLANASKRLDLQERKIRGQIKDTFIEYRLLLERRQEAQIGILHDKTKEQKSQINARFVEVCTQGSKLQKLYDAFLKARKSNDITQLFTIHNEIKEKEQEFANAADMNDDALFVSCNFSVQNEGQFFSEMSMLGDVETQPDLELKTPVPAHQLVVLDMEERRYQEDPQDLECEDLMVTHVEPSTRRDDIPGEVRLPHSSSRSRASRMRAMETEDDMENMEHDDAITSQYLLRIASRLNATSSNLSEAILDLSSSGPHDTDIHIPEAPNVRSSSQSGSRSSNSRPRRSQSAQNVQVVRHPQLHSRSNYTSSRYNEDQRN